MTDDLMKNALSVFSSLGVDKVQVGSDVYETRPTIVVKMPHLPHQTALMMTDKLGLAEEARKMISSHQSVRGLPPSRIVALYARHTPLNFRDHEMVLALAPYENDDRYSVEWKDADQVLEVER